MAIFSTILEMCLEIFSKFPEILKISKLFMKIVPKIYVNVSEYFSKNLYENNFNF